jgi:hypothetical protein
MEKNRVYLARARLRPAAEPTTGRESVLQVPLSICAERLASRQGSHAENVRRIFLITIIMCYGSNAPFVEDYPSFAEPSRQTISKICTLAMNELSHLGHAFACFNIIWIT